MSDLKVRNNMSAASLKIQENANIEFILNPKNGNLFFACGTKQGYISPKVKEAFANDSLKLEDMNYAECQKPGQSDWTPCLMMKNSSNVKATF